MKHGRPLVTERTGGSAVDGLSSASAKTGAGKWSANTPFRCPRSRIPHTRTGKKLEVPVKRLLQGTPADEVVNLATVDNPDLIAYFAELGTERRGGESTSAANRSV